VEVHQDLAAADGAGTAVLGDPRDLRRGQCRKDLLRTRCGQRKWSVGSPILIHSISRPQLTIQAAIASHMPARRAAKVIPVALRYE